MLSVSDVIFDAVCNFDNLAVSCFRAIFTVKNGVQRSWVQDDPCVQPNHGYYLNFPIPHLLLYNRYQMFFATPLIYWIVEASGLAHRVMPIRPEITSRSRTSREIRVTFPLMYRIICIYLSPRRYIWLQAHFPFWSLSNETTLFCPPSTDLRGRSKIALLRSNWICNQPWNTHILYHTEYEHTCASWPKLCQA